MGLAQVLRDLPARPPDPRLLVGTETSDDAGVYLVADGLAMVQTLDFFPPLVDDPYTFGRIAAANALSDIYAMNARPITALNIVGFPDNELPLEILGEILRGGGDTVALAGASLLGGHSVRDAEIKYGLSVTGLADPRAILTNASARPGDLLVLTKPLGTGFVTTANKKDQCPPDVLANAVASMTQLNAVGRDALIDSGGAHAATDITGFGLAGHATEMAEGSGVTLVFDLEELPRIVGSEQLAIPTFFTRATKSNREFVGGRIEYSSDLDPTYLEYLFDAQTSGGLLIAVAPEHADRLVRGLADRGALASKIIGRVEPRRGPIALSIC